jgi:hypothetical protein
MHLLLSIKHYFDRLKTTTTIQRPKKKHIQGVAATKEW